MSAFNLFGNNASSQPSTTPASTGGIGNLFANAAKANSSAPAPSLFGSSLQTSTAPTTSAAAPFNLFGGSSAASSAPAIPSINIQPASAAGTTPSLGGLFGNANSASSAAPATEGLFGNANNANSSAPAAGGLFGAASTGTTTTAAPGGLFGSSTIAQPAQQSNTLFGGSGTQQVASGGSGLFGAGNSTNSTDPAGFKPLFSTLGGQGLQQQPQQNQQQQQQQQQTVPGVRIDINNVKPTTRFYELHESLQQEIIQAEDFIQSQINLITKCEVFIPAHGNSLSSVAPDVKFVSNKLETVAQALVQDAGEINAVKNTLVQDIQDCQKEFKAVEHLKLPAQWQYNQQWASTADGIEGDNVIASTDMVPYFNRHTTEMDVRLNKYKSQLAEIEAHLRTVEGSAVEQMRKIMQRQANGEQERGPVAELASAMHVFEEAVLRVAGKVGETREGVIDVTLGRMYPNGSTRR